jgi:hypothetical protein
MREYSLYFLLLSITISLGILIPSAFGSTIDIPDKTITSIAVNEKTNQIYVTGDVGLQGRNHLYVLDSNTNQVTSQTDVCFGQGIAVNEDSNLIYMGGCDAIDIYDTNTLKKIYSIKTGIATQEISINLQTNKIYAYGLTDDDRVQPELIILDGKTNGILNTILINSGGKLVINKKTNDAYIQDLSQDQSHNVIKIIDGNTDQIKNTIDIDNNRFAELNDDENVAYSISPNSIVVSNVSTGNTISNIDYEGMYFPDDLIFDSGKNLLYLLNSRSIYDVDLKTNKSTQLTSPDPSNGGIWVMNHNTRKIYEIDQYHSNKIVIINLENSNNLSTPHNNLPNTQSTQLENNLNKNIVFLSKLPKYDMVSNFTSNASDITEFYKYVNYNYNLKITSASPDGKYVSFEVTGPPATNNPYLDDQVLSSTTSLAKDFHCKYINPKTDWLYYTNPCIFIEEVSSKKIIQITNEICYTTYSGDPGDDIQGTGKIIAIKGNLVACVDKVKNMNIKNYDFKEYFDSFIFDPFSQMYYGKSEKNNLILNNKISDDVNAPTLYDEPYDSADIIYDKKFILYLEYYKHGDTWGFYSLEYMDPISDISSTISGIDIDENNRNNFLFYDSKACCKFQSTSDMQYIMFENDPFLADSENLDHSINIRDLKSQASTKIYENIQKTIAELFPNMSDDGRFIVYNQYDYHDPLEVGWQTKIAVYDKQSGHSTNIPINVPYCISCIIPDKYPLSEKNLGISPDGRFVMWQYVGHTYSSNEFEFQPVEDKYSPIKDNTFFIHDLTNNETKIFEPYSDGVLKYYSYVPLFTQDSKLIFLANKNGIEDIFISDLKSDFDSQNQLNKKVSSIPSWIKNNAKLWHDGSIGDDDFVKGIQYMIQNGIISIPQTHQGSDTSQSIPSWIKNNAGWWVDGQISDDDFAKGLEYLVQSGVIHVQNLDSPIMINFSNLTTVKNGDTQSLSFISTQDGAPLTEVHIQAVITPFDSSTPVNSFNGITDSSGKFTCTWKIGDDYKLGEIYYIKVSVSKDGFGNNSTSSSFEVIN